jgi:hypothetical protein
MAVVASNRSVGNMGQMMALGLKDALKKVKNGLVASF